MAASQQQQQHSCARGPPIDASDQPPIFFMENFDASRMTFTRPSWDNVKGLGSGSGSGSGAGAGSGAGVASGSGAAAGSSVVGRGGGAGGGRFGAGGGRGRGGGRGFDASGSRDEQQSVVFLGPQNSRTMYCRSTVSPFRIQMIEGVIQKIGLPGGADHEDGADIPDSASDAELLRHYAGKRLNVKIRFDDIELTGSESEEEAGTKSAKRAQFLEFWNGWQNAAVRPFVEHHDALFPDQPLLPAIMRQHLNAEAYRESEMETARQIFQKRSPLFFQKDTSKSYTVRMRVQVQKTFNPEQFAFNECVFFANRGDRDANGALQLPMSDASVLRRGARIIAVFTSGGMYINGNGEVGHHVQMMQAVVKPYTHTTFSRIPRLSVHIPGVDAINILIPTEAPSLQEEAAGAAEVQPKKRGRREDDFAAFYDDAGAAGGFA